MVEDAVAVGMGKDSRMGFPQCTGPSSIKVKGIFKIQHLADFHCFIYSSPLTFTRETAIYDNQIDPILPISSNYRSRMPSSEKAGFGPALPGRLSIFQQNRTGCNDFPVSFNLGVFRRIAFEDANPAGAFNGQNTIGADQFLRNGMPHDTLSRLPDVCYRFTRFHVKVTRVNRCDCPNSLGKRTGAVRLGSICAKDTGPVTAGFITDSAYTLHSPEQFNLFRAVLYTFPGLMPIPLILTLCCEKRNTEKDCGGY
jgi:hypothetical protein